MRWKEPWPGRLARWAGAASILGIAALVAFYLSSYRSAPDLEDAPAQPAERFDRLHVKGLQYTSSIKGRKIFSLAAEELIHRKRKVGPLTLNPVKEIALVGVRIEIHDLGGESGRTPGEGEVVLLGLPVRKIVEETASSQGLGFVSRVLVDRVEIAFLSVKGTEILNMTAGRATLGLDTSEVTLSRDVSFRSAEGEELTAREVTWRQEDGLLLARGDYLLRNAPGGEERRGRDGRFTLTAAGRIRPVDPAMADRP